MYAPQRTFLIAGDLNSTFAREASLLSPSEKVFVMSFRTHEPRRGQASAHAVKRRPAVGRNRVLSVSATGNAIPPPDEIQRDRGRSLLAL